MSQWEELQTTERHLLSQVEQTEDDQRQVQRIQEEYDQHFQRADRFLETVTFTYRKNARTDLFMDVRSDFFQKHRQVMEHLAEDEAQLKQEQNRLEQEQESIRVQKQQVLREEQTYER